MAGVGGGCREGDGRRGPGQDGPSGPPVSSTLNADPESGPLPAPLCAPVSGSGLSDVHGRSVAPLAPVCPAVGSKGAFQSISQVRSLFIPNLQIPIAAEVQGPYGSSAPPGLHPAFVCS